jgi:hypothetical protein
MGDVQARAAAVMPSIGNGSGSGAGGGNAVAPAFIGDLTAANLSVEWTAFQLARIKQFMQQYTFCKQLQDKGVQGIVQLCHNKGNAKRSAQRLVKSRTMHLDSSLSMCVPCGTVFRDVSSCPLCIIS